MQRFEITGTATDVFTLVDIQSALRRAGAKDVRSRQAFGWSNQPQVATFAALDQAAAREICEAAWDDLPALLPFEYGLK